MSGVTLSTHINIQQLKPFDPVAVWPNGIEVCIARVPIRKRDGYSLDMMKNLATKLKNNMTLNGLVYLICYAPSEAKARPFEVADLMVKAGFSHVDNIVIEKTWMPGKKSENTLVNSNDFVLVFCNGTVWKIDRTPVKHYMMTEEASPCIGNTWLVETGSLDDAYSDDLAELLLRFSALLPGSSVFDPFMGNSAIVKACLKLGHSLNGFETDQRKIQQYKKVIDDYVKETKQK